MQSSMTSRSGSNSHKAGWCSEDSCSRVVVGIQNPLKQILQCLLAVALQPAIDLRLGEMVERVHDVSPRLSILEQHEQRNRENRHHILQKYVHRDAEDFSVEKSPQDVGDGGQS